MRFSVLGKLGLRRSKERGTVATRDSPSTLDVASMSQGSRCSIRDPSRTSSCSSTRTYASRASLRASGRFSAVSLNVAGVADVSLPGAASGDFPPPVTPRARWTFLSKAFLTMGRRAAATSDAPTDREFVSSKNPLASTGASPRPKSSSNGGSYVEFPIQLDKVSGEIVPPPRWRPPANGITKAARKASTSRPRPSITSISGLRDKTPRGSMTEFTLQQWAKRRLSENPQARLPRQSVDSSCRVRLSSSSSSLYSVTSSGSVYLSTAPVAGELTAEQAEPSPTPYSANSVDGWAARRIPPPKLVLSCSNCSVSGDADCDCGIESDPPTPTSKRGSAVSFSLEQADLWDSIGRCPGDSRPSISRETQELATGNTPQRRQSFIVVDTVCSVTGRHEVARRVDNLPLTKRSRDDVVRMLIRYAPREGAFAFRESRGKVVLSIWDGFGAQHFGVNDGARPLTADDFGPAQFRKFFRVFRNNKALPVKLTCAVQV